ncbi:hypothetical protein KR054_003301 [Drosophila jambulina]|nr:hypothetical protein KR054_003301 [Drosophila jambulina]
MQLLRTAIIWVWLAVAGPNCFLSLATGHQVQVRIPFWDVGGVIKQVTGYMTGQESGHPPKKKERPHREEYWPHYGYYDPAHMYPPYYYPYPPYPPPTYPPMPTKGPTNPPTTKKPTEPTTNKPTEMTTNPSTGMTTVTTTGRPVTTTVPPVQTTERPTTVTTTTERPTTVTTTTERPTTVTTTTEAPNEETTTNPPARDLCRIYPLLPECRNIKSVHQTKNKHSGNVLQQDQKLSIRTEPHPVTSLCFYYPRLCMKPEEAQFVTLSDENGRPLVLISPADKKSVNSKG